VAVSHPSYVHPNGHRYIFIPFEHVPRPSQVWYETYMADPTGRLITQRCGILLEHPPVACDWPKDKGAER